MTRFRILMPGRTSLRWSLPALLLAPAIGLVPCSMLLAAASLGGTWETWGLAGSLASFLTLLALTYAALAAGTLGLGGPTWLILRMLRRESGVSYILAGAVEALLAAIHFGYAGHGLPRPDTMMAFAFCGFLGGFVALAFWFIAREGDAKTMKLGPVQ